MSKNLDGIYELTKDQLKEISGGLHPIFWLLIGIAVGGVSDFEKGQEDAKKSY